MKTETITYHTKNCLSQGFLAYDSLNNEKRPAVIVVHPWQGCNDFTKKKALEVASLGYLAFAIDLYGNGQTATSDNEAANLMKPLFIDRATLQERMIAAFELIANHPLTDPKQIGAIGFCFGGLSVIELLRTGVNLLGAVSFHGVLGDHLGEYQATPGDRTSRIKGSLLVLHGFNDPLVPSSDITLLENEMSEKGADWQINIYGNTSHAFMNEDMHSPEKGLVYNPKTAKRAWQSMINFFNEIFGKI